MANKMDNEKVRQKIFNLLLDICENDLPLQNQIYCVDDTTCFNITNEIIEKYLTVNHWKKKIWQTFRSVL